MSFWKIKMIMAWVSAITGFHALAQNIVTIPVETKDNALVLQTDADQHLFITYFGRKLSQASEYPFIPLQSH